MPHKQSSAGLQSPGGTCCHSTLECSARDKTGSEGDFATHGGQLGSFWVWVLLLTGVELIFFTVAGDSVDNSGIFWSLLSSSCTQHAKAPSASHPTLPMRRLRVHEELRGGTASTADPK